MKQYPHNIIKGNNCGNRYVLKEHLKLEACKFTGDKDVCLYGFNQNSEISVLIDKDLEICKIYDKAQNEDISYMVRHTDTSFCYEFKEGKVILYKDSNNDIFVVIASF